MLNPTTRALVENQLHKCEEALANQIRWRDGLLADLDKSNEGIEQLQLQKRELQESLLEEVSV